MNSMAWLMLALGAGIGAGVGFLIGALTPRRDDGPGPAAEPHGEIYYGDGRWQPRHDEDDHPADIERQGSHLVPAPAAAVSKRSWDERYDGMDERRLLD